MRVLVRTTVAGNEYWDTEGKRTIFIPTGQEPDFEVTENPDSMITQEIKEVQTPEDPLEGMSIKELREYAAEHDIKIPSEAKKQKAIHEFLTQENAAD